MHGSPQKTKPLCKCYLNPVERQRRCRQTGLLRHLAIPLSIYLPIYLLICSLWRRRRSSAHPTISSVPQPAPGPQTPVSKLPAEGNPGGPDVISEQKQWSGIRRHPGERTGRGRWPMGPYGKGVSPGTRAHSARAVGTGGGYLPGHNVPEDISYRCPRGGQRAPCGANRHAAGLNAGRCIAGPMAVAAAGRALQAEDRHRSPQVSAMWR